MISLPTRIERAGFRLRYRLADLTYAVGIATPKRGVAGTYWSYEPTDPHGDDPGLAALEALPADATIVDAGAHVGEHAIPLALDTDRHVIAFEPNGESADRLARNARRNGLRVTGGDPASGGGSADAVDLRRAGLGDATATLSFYRSTFSKLSAFDRDRATRWGAEVAAVESVPILRLDDIVRESDGEDGATGKEPAGDDLADAVPPPDAIKVDVEGHEAAVLRGAARTIATYRPLLVIEVHDEAGDRDGDTQSGGESPRPSERDLREWLVERGYTVEPAEDVWICRG